MPKTRAKNLLTQPNIRRLRDSLMEAVGVQYGPMSEETRKAADLRALEIVRTAGGELAYTGNTGNALVTNYGHFVNFVNINRRRLHRFVLIAEPYTDPESPHMGVYMIPADAAEKILVLGWPKPEPPGENDEIR
jgi:hypothetical protein